MILAAFAVPWIPHVARQIWMLAAIALSALGSQPVLVCMLYGR